MFVTKHSIGKNCQMQNNVMNELESDTNYEIKTD